MLSPVDVSERTPDEITYADLCERLSTTKSLRSRLQVTLQREVSNLLEEYFDSLSNNHFDDAKRGRARPGVWSDDRFTEKQVSQLLLSGDNSLDFAISTGVGLQPQQPAVTHFVTRLNVTMHEDNLRFMVEGNEILIPAGGTLPKYAVLCDAIKRHVWQQCSKV